MLDLNNKTVNEMKTVDICFSGSLCGELKYYLRDKYKDIITIPLFFDIGLLSGDALENQKANIYDMYIPFGITQKDCDKMFEDIKTDISKIVTYAKSGAIFRIWNENTPTSICGMYYILKLLMDYECNIYEVFIEQNQQPNLDNMIKLSKEKIENYVYKWERLVEENLPLRVSVNGDISSVKETYFDDIILDVIGKQKMHISKIVGEVMSKYKISDTYIFTRIYYLVNTEKLKIIGTINSNDKPNYYPYNQIIKKNV